MNDWVEGKINLTERTVYGGSMPSRNKEVLRKVLVKEHDFGEWQQRDYVYGHDEGEPPQGADW